MDALMVKDLKKTVVSYLAIKSSEDHLPDILPALLQQRNQIVDSQHDVGDEFVLGHAHVADSHAQTQHLLQLELDGALDLGELGAQVVGVGDRGGELAGLGQTRTEQTGDLFDEGVGGDEGVVLAGQLLDQLLVLVQLLQVVRRHGVDAEVLGPVQVVLVAEDADGHARPRHRGQLDRARESLVALRVIVLQADLQLHRLEEIAFLLVERIVKQFLDVACGEMID